MQRIPAENEVRLSSRERFQVRLIVKPEIYRPDELCCRRGHAKKLSSGHQVDMQTECDTCGEVVNGRNAVRMLRNANYATVTPDEPRWSSHRVGFCAAST